MNQKLEYSVCYNYLMELSASNQAFQKKDQRKEK